MFSIFNLKPPRCVYPATEALRSRLSGLACCMSAFASCVAGGFGIFFLGREADRRGLSGPRGVSMRIFFGRKLYTTAESSFRDFLPLKVLFQSVKYSGAKMAAADCAPRLQAQTMQIPGRVSNADKRIIAGAYHLLRRRPDAGKRSALRVVDSLDSRYRFQVSNPRDLDSNALRALELKLQKCRSVILDLPRSRVIVECWRDTHNEERRGKKRARRDLEDVEELPQYIEDELTPLMTSMPKSVQVLRELMLWIINREEDFVSFVFTVEFDDAAEMFRLSLKGFDAVTLGFVKDLNHQWKTFVRDVVFEFGSKSLTLLVSR